MVLWKIGTSGWPGAYDESGKKLITPSVSAIVNSKEDPDLDNWIKEVGEEKAAIISKMSMDRGTAMHKFLENYYLALAIKKDPDKSLLYAQKKSVNDLKEENIQDVSINTGRNLFYQIKEEFDNRQEIYKVLGTEKKIIGYELGYRGMYDINYIKKQYNKLQNIITDYKSASSPIKEKSIKERKYKLQLAGYWYAYEVSTSSNLSAAKIWVSIKNYGTQEIAITDRKEYEDLFDEFKELAVHFHTKNNQDINIFKNYKINKN